LVVTEFALSLVLMIAASLLLRSFWDLLKTPLGFNLENTMFVRTRLPYPNDTSIDKYKTASQQARFFHEVIRRGLTLPGVKEVAMGDTASVPLDASERALNMLAEGHFFFTMEGSRIEQPGMVARSNVTPEYFHLLRMPLLRGRLFNDGDTDQTPQVAVVNEAMVRTFWPREDPIGKRLKSTRAESPWVTVIGVIANSRTDSLAQGDVPKLYLSLYQNGAKHVAIYLRGHLDPAAIPCAVRDEVQSVDPTLPVFGAQTLNETVSASLATRRFSMEMVALFALTALLLAALGIYGVISYIVSERAHEFGIRRALGAQGRSIMGMVLRQGLALAITGTGIGLIGALIVSNLMAGLLYGVKPTDPATFVGVTFLLVGVALLACIVPAQRALRVDPMVALRCE
jgi:putative ABC transport system permease protein